VQLQWRRSGSQRSASDTRTLSRERAKELLDKLREGAGIRRRDRDEPEVRGASEGVRHDA
jgi:hypothetical protein